VKPNPALAALDAGTAVEYLDLPRDADAKKPVRLRVKLTDARGHKARAGVRDVQVTWYQAPGALRSAVLASEAGAGVYEAELSFPEAGAWYVQVTVPSLKVGPGEAPHRSVVVRGPTSTAAVR
jgi:hypothetical protein